MNKDQIISIINDLPIDQRIEIADQILQSLHQVDPEIEKAWAKEARRRLDEFEEGKVKAIPGDQVFEQLREKYSK
ncbi:addiction module protein [Rhodohalobacter sp. SW132]|uniref:addiction module protein n=1 Tax=Rhodohalobacter sp. SW132 TaxID=2293433 RepID=UPI000E25859F|nr:addiction module protein [Rhodohalobacter sp. SW132]REL32971.1 addiction module protein [Rhodohalobacter sp. SW132]